MPDDRINVQFSGDRTDPWVRALLEALPAGTTTIPGTGLPDSWPGPDRPDVLVIHRPNLGMAEADQLRRWRAGGNGPRVLLVAGRHVRYHHLMAWSGLVDLVLPESTAVETIARHLRPGKARQKIGAGTVVAIASGQFELSRMLADSVESAGYRAVRRRDDPSEGEEPWVIWDVPVLEPDWPDRLAASSRDRGVIAMLGLADRELVAQARRSGAIACLDLPCDPDDLVFVLDRITSSDARKPQGRSTSRRLPHGPQQHRPRSRPGSPRVEEPRR